MGLEEKTKCSHRVEDKDQTKKKLFFCLSKEKCSYEYYGLNANGKQVKYCAREELEKFFGYG